MNAMMSVIMITNIKKHSIVLFGLIALLLSVSFAQDFWQAKNENHQQSQLPLATLSINGRVIQVELALAPKTQAYGLMNRLILPENEGMLFVFSKEQSLSFWMKNTKIPLDILYFNQDGVLVDYAEAIPCVADPCPSYPSKALARYVLEIGKGERARLGIELGSQLEKID